MTLIIKEVVVVVVVVVVDCYCLVMQIVSVSELSVQMSP